MNAIYKYPIEVKDLVEVEMPQGARILTVQVQVGQETTEVNPGHGFGAMKAYGRITETVCLWAMSNTEESKTVRRMFRIYGTGKPIDEDPANLDYIGTVQTGSFVWHIFERKAPPPRCQRCGAEAIRKHFDGTDLDLCAECWDDWRIYADTGTALHGPPTSWPPVLEKFLKTEKGAK